MKRPPLLSIVSILTTILTTAESAQAAGRDIEGAWTARWTFTQSSIPSLPPGAGFDALHAFHKGGTVTSVDDDFFDSTGVGEWESTGSRRYTFRIAFFIADEQSPSHTAAFISHVTASVTYDPGQDRWNGTFRSALYDREGHVLAEFAGSVAATRLPR